MRALAMVRDRPKNALVRSCSRAGRSRPLTSITVWVREASLSIITVGCTVKTLARPGRWLRLSPRATDNSNLPLRILSMFRRRRAMLSGREIGRPSVSWIEKTSSAIPSVVVKIRAPAMEAPLTVMAPARREKTPG